MRQTQQLTHSFRVPLQIRCPLGEVSCHVQYLGVACWWIERVAQHQRQQWKKQQVVKGRHDSLTPFVLKEPLFVCVADSHMQPRMHVDELSHTLYITPSKIIMQLQENDPSHCVRSLWKNKNSTRRTDLLSKITVLLI